MAVRPRTETPRLLVVDAVALALVSVVATSALGDVFAGSAWQVAVVAGVLLASGVTLVARRLRWGPVLTVLATVLGYLLVGPAVAAPQDATAAVLPSLEAERVLVVGVVESWRSVLTLPLPLGSGRGELVVPFVLALVGGLVSTTLLWRTRHPGLCAVPVSAMFVAAAAFGARDAELPLLRAALLVVVLLPWLRWRTTRAGWSSWARRVALGSAVLAVAAGTAFGLASLTAPAPREVLRDHVEPPLAQLDLKSPLARYRDYYKSGKDDVLLTFEGLPAGEPLVRLAAMDHYDGVVWNVSTDDLSSGTSAFRAASYEAGTSEVVVGVEGYDGPWVPTVGLVRGARLESGETDARELLVNPATGTVAMYGGTRSGDSYRIAWAPRTPRVDELSEVDVDRTVPLPDLPFAAIEPLDQLADLWIARSGAASDYDRALALEQGFRDEGYFNDGLTPEERGYSASGHGARRLADLAQDPRRMVGNDEQYAAAMAYALQRLGLPARVVLGFEGVRADGTVVGDDIAAWVELPFVDRGWIAFDPTPPEDQKPPPLQDDPNPEPQPYVVQPPVLPQEPAEVQGVAPAGAGSEETDPGSGLLEALLRGLVVLAQVAAVTAPLWLVVLLKRRRRRRRRREPDPVVRLGGAWREVTDRARDLGTRLERHETRLENGQVLERRFPDCEPVLLAARADRYVFGPGRPSDEEVAAYWADVDSALRRMRRAVPWWRRPLAWFSPVSLGSPRSWWRARRRGR